MIKIFFTRKNCIGCNACVELNPKRWRISRKDGKSILLGAEEKKGIYFLETEEDDFELTKKISDNCPSRIIRVEKVKEEYFLQ